jgi:hypothetical protein
MVEDGARSEDPLAPAAAALAALAPPAACRWTAWADAAAAD